MIAAVMAGVPVRLRHLAILVPLALTARATRLAAQGAVVRGQVLHVDAGTPIAGAEVRSRGNDRRIETDSGGWFDLRDLPAGPVNIGIRQVGFQPVTLSLVLTAGETRTVKVLLTPAVTTLDPIITTATRDARSLADVAAAVSLADTLAIRRDRTVGLDEALRTMPGVQATSRYGTDDVNIGIRGSAARARQAVRGVAVLLDGVALSEPDGVARLDLIELSAARRIEVIRGPVSALYAGSANGVVNIISRSGYDSPGISLLAEGGSYGFQKYEGQAGGSLADGRGSAFAAGSYTESDNYRAHSDGQVSRGLLRGDYQLFPQTSVALDAEGSALDTRLPGELNQAQFDANPDAAAPAALFFNFRRADTRYRIGTRLLQGLDASGNTEASAYLYYGGRTLDFPIPGEVVDLNLHRSQLGARVRSLRVGGAPVDLAGGVDYDRVYGTDQRWANPGGGGHGAKLDNSTLSVPTVGIYAQGAWQAGPAVDVTLGLRYDEVEYQFTSDFPGQIPSQDKVYQQWSPKGTVAWQTGARTHLYGSIARGFEVPAIGELGGFLPGDSINSSLQPKSLWNFEVGAKGLLGARLQYDAAVFYADVTGEFVPRTVNGFDAPENASHSRNVGVELALTFPATRWADLSVTYTFSDFRLVDYATTVVDSAGTREPVIYDGNLLPGVPQQRVTAEVVTRPARSLSLGMQLELQSLMYVETGNQASGVTYFQPGPAAPTVAVPFRAVPARTLVQLNGRYQLGPVGLFGVVENLFGTRYTANVVANSDIGAYYDAGPGTWVTLGANVSAWPHGF